MLLQLLLIFILCLQGHADSVRDEDGILLQFGLLCLDSRVEDGHIETRECGDSEEWFYDDTDYSLHPVNASDLCLTVNETEVIVAECNETLDQQFELRDRKLHIYNDSDDLDSCITILGTISLGKEPVVKPCDRAHRIEIVCSETEYRVEGMKCIKDKHPKPSPKQPKESPEDIVPLESPPTKFSPDVPIHPDCGPDCQPNIPVPPAPCDPCDPSCMLPAGSCPPATCYPGCWGEHFKLWPFRVSASLGNNVYCTYPNIWVLGYWTVFSNPLVTTYDKSTVIMIQTGISLYVNAYVIIIQYPANDFGLAALCITCNIPLLNNELLLSLFVVVRGTPEGNVINDGQMVVFVRREKTFTVTKVFVWCNAVCTLLQYAGGSLSQYDPVTWRLVLPGSCAYAVYGHEVIENIVEPAPVTPSQEGKGSDLGLLGLLGLIALPILLLLAALAAYLWWLWAPVPPLPVPLYPVPCVEETMFAVETPLVPQPSPVCCATTCTPCPGPYLPACAAASPCGAYIPVAASPPVVSPCGGYIPSAYIPAPTSPTLPCSPPALPTAYVAV